MQEKPKTVLANRSLVKEFAEMEPAPYDRPMSERRLLVYQRILKSGDFRPVTWASALCAETNCTYRVNGKHTSTMLSGIDPIPEFYVTVERWYCETLNDVANLYNTYDSTLSSRTAKDVNLAFAATMRDMNDIPPRLIHLIVSAAANLKWDEAEIRKVPQAERAEELLERTDFAKWLHKIVPTPNSFGPGSLTKHLLRAPVVQAMMATYDRTPRAAFEFWESVRDESDPSRDNASRTLARFLVRAAMASGRGLRNTEKKVVGHREMFVKCLHAWNAWRKGETTSLSYYAKAPIPAVAK